MAGNTTINVRVTQPADRSAIEWQLIGPHAPAAQGRLADFISRTTAYAEQHRIHVLDALTLQDPDPTVRVDIQAAREANRNLPLAQRAAA